VIWLEVLQATEAAAAHLHTEIILQLHPVHLIRFKSGLVVMVVVVALPEGIHFL